ncbi:hypothetical protein GCM10011390_02610 [Aureimonas endophytica]|uniref:Uncharacterized protein n=1 Tax=Aureimonas endophytica TaxID=2027858 RepID=A0A916ZBZ8_9HYPH|nr:hypothetical protein [Aureimonas endophytica]GGD87370.1 hypothetical protein GCM10011390_02610 [Aureimonas endophytica]
MRISGDVWTKEDDADLARLARSGASISYMSAWFGRSKGAISVRLSRRRLRPREGVDVDAVERLFVSGSTAVETANRLGLTLAQVRGVLRYHAIVRPGSTIHPRWVRRPHDDRILALSGEGLGPAGIARRLGVPAAHVRSRLLTIARREAVEELRSDSPSISSRAQSAAFGASA